MTRIEIDKNSKTPVYIQIQQAIFNKILAGTVADGYTLPSERKLASELDVHRNTVSRAYSELKSRGLIESCPGVGYIVNYKKGTGASEKKKAVNWDALLNTGSKKIKSDFDELYSKSFDENLISFAGGVASRDVYPPEEIAGTFASILNKSSNTAYFHMPYQGSTGLRKEITEFLSLKGIRTSPANIQVFAENNQSLDFVLSLMLSPGDRVLIDETMSADVYRAITLAGGEVINVPGDENGMQCDNLEPIIKKHKPKFIYVDSSFNNPRGVYLSTERKLKLLELSYKFRIPIIEEDEASDIYYDTDPVPSIKSMDCGENVIYMYSFSLTMVPGLGLSCLIADSRIIERLREMVSLRIASPDWASQILLLEYMQSGIFYERLNDFRQEYREKRDLMCYYLDRLAIRYGIEYEKPEGGVYIWVKLPSRINARKLLKVSQSEGLTFMPGYLFYAAKSMGKNYLRLNFSYPTRDNIVKGMEILERSIEVLLC